MPINTMISIHWPNGEVHTYRTTQQGRNELADKLNDLLVRGHIGAGDLQCGAGDLQCAPREPDGYRKPDGYLQMENETDSGYMKIVLVPYYEKVYNNA